MSGELRTRNAARGRRAIAGLLHLLSLLALACLLGFAPIGVRFAPGVQAGSLRYYEPATPPLHVLVIGGGPDKTHNQAAIESNVRYIARLLPKGSPMRVLFADGSLASQNVQCEGDDGIIYYRAPNLPRLDGPAKRPKVSTELDALSGTVRSQPDTPVLLYFTGHGSPDKGSGYNNNAFDLWGGDEFSVKDLAQRLKTFPKTTPITIVMVQCFSGAFGNLLFENADVTAALADQRVCGFFAAVPTRMAAGCTPQIKEATYQDFSGYFFAGLTGTDRLGRKAAGADYNHDGRIGMNEAFIYALLHDDSIDTPVCTSDVFLRKFIKTTDKEVFQTPYSSVRSWAGPAQLAGLDGLSKQIGLQGEARLSLAYDEFKTLNMDTDALRDVRLARFVRLAKSVILAHTLGLSGEAQVKSRYAELVRDEGGNPLRR